MKVFITYDDLPLKHESFFDVKSVSAVPESVKDYYDGEDHEEYQIYKVIMLQNNRSVIRHNVQCLEII